MVAYKNSKLANVWFTYELVRRLENTGVDVHALCPVKQIDRQILLDDRDETIFAFSKGFVPTTDLARDTNVVQRFFMSHIMSLFPFTRFVSSIKSFRSTIEYFRTEDFGSDCEVFAATSETLNGRTGVFMSDMKETRSSDESYDVDKAKQLWILSEQWTQLNQ